MFAHMAGSKLVPDSFKYITSIPEEEVTSFKSIVNKHRKALIPTPQQIVTEVMAESPHYAELIRSKKVSEAISQIREAVWKRFLIAEAPFNAAVMKDIGDHLNTPRSIIDNIIGEHVLDGKAEELHETINVICGEYTARAYPYLYALSLSNTNSRRSRSGKTLEKIVYAIYEILDYPYDSQSKAGKRIFTEAGIGKLVDSILPGIDTFLQRRDKVIIGTMKTSLRERWQEVSEEIQRTGIPKIHLLTVDDDISLNKAKQMAEHNIIVVTYKDVANSEKLKNHRSIVSFEDYFFDEIPDILKYWKQKT